MAKCNQLTPLHFTGLINCSKPQFNRKLPTTGNSRHFTTS